MDEVGTLGADQLAKAHHRGERAERAGAAAVLGDRMKSKALRADRRGVPRDAGGDVDLMAGVARRPGDAEEMRNEEPVLVDDVEDFHVSVWL